MPDPFATLPAPLPLMIIEEIEDLPTLYYLLQALPTVSIIFSRGYGRIIEGIVSRYSAWVQGPISVVLKLRGDNRESLLHQTRSPEDIDFFLKEHLPSESLPPQSMAKKPRSLRSARSILRTAVTIQKIADHFLETHLQRTHSVMSSYLTYQSQQATSTHSGALANRIAVDFSQWTTPSWLEQQRVLKSLWRLQLYLDLLAIRLPHTTAPSDERMTRYLRDWGPTRLYSKLLAYSEVVEMNYVHRYISTTFYDLNGYNPGDTRRLEVLPQLQISTVSTPVSLRGPGEGTHFWMQADRAAALQAPGAQFLLRAYTRYRFPESMTGIWTFRCLGFLMWDLKRMIALGLLVDPHNLVEQDEYSMPEWVDSNISTTGVIVDEETFRGMVAKWQQLLAHINDTDHSWAWFQE